MKILVNEAGDSVMGLCLFSVLDTSQAFRLFSPPTESMPLSVNVCAMTEWDFKRPVES